MAGGSRAQARRAGIYSGLTWRMTSLPYKQMKKETPKFTPPFFSARKSVNLSKHLKKLKASALSMCPSVIFCVRASSTKRWTKRF